MLQTFVPH